MSVILRSKKLKNKGVSYYLDIYHNGKRRYEFLGIKTDPENDSPEKRKEKKELANTQRSQIELELLADGTKYLPKHIKEADFLIYYENYLKNYTKRDVRMIRYSLEKFRNFLDKYKREHSFKKITPELCEGFREYLQSKEANLSGETPQNYFARFKKVLKAATRKGFFKENPAIDVIFKRSDQSENLKKEILTADELRTLSNTYCGNNEVKRAFLFACFTGLGIAEIRTLTWYALNNNRLKTHRAKTGSEINIPLSRSALKLVGERRPGKEKVFDLNISDIAISKDLKNWVKRAEIDKNISFYCGRHTFAVQLLMNGSNLKTVSDCMGHKNTRHTIKYLNYVDSLRDEAVSNLPEL